MRHRTDVDFSLMPEYFPARLRRHVRIFGRFVRLAEGITDNALLDRNTRIERLAMLEGCISGTAEPDWSADARAVATGLRNSLRTTGVNDSHCRHILKAFRRDLDGVRSHTWDDLMVYCQLAAAPIGRHMLELSGEDVAACARYSDALCAALRILRQLRDCEDPSIQDNRLCIPESFMEDAYITSRHLRSSKLKGQSKAVVDRVLDGVEQLLTDAHPLPSLIRSRGLRVHIRIVQCRARKLVGCFREQDPMQQRVGLTSWQRRTCEWFGFLSGIVG